MDKFYIINNSIDNKIIGNEFPQCTGTLKGYNNEYENPLSLYYFAHQKGIEIDYEPDLSAIKVGLKTKMTDYISCSLGPGNDSVISSKFRNLLKRYKTSPLQMFKCILNRKEEQFKYFWIHYIYSLEKIVDYRQSVFSHPNEKFESKLRSIKSYEDYRYFYDNDDTYGLIRADKTVLNAAPLDFFVIGQFNQKHYVSEGLKDALEIKGISGLTFKEATDIHFQSK
jgi:hypothetical protein